MIVQVRYTLLGIPYLKITIILEKWTQGKFPTFMHPSVVA